MAAQIADYKKFRDIVADANATLLSAQAPVDENSWDVLQELSPDGLRAVIFAFKSNNAEGRIVVKPRNLKPDVVYQVESLDIGYIGSERGQFLMQDGIEIVHDVSSRAHVLILRRQ